MQTLTGAQALVRCLQAESVAHIFGVVGGKLGPLLHAIANQPSLRYVGLRHEASGPMMAAAAHAASGQIAVALGEMGPGSLNLASGLGVAFGNNIPVLAITTNQHRAAAYPHSGMFMDLDTRAIFGAITKWNAVVHDARRIPELTRRAFREALSGRPGPVHLDIPQDVLASQCEFHDAEFSTQPSSYRSIDGPRPAASVMAKAIALLSQAKRPLIVAGGGVVHSSDASTKLRILAERLKAPVIPTQMALGVIASSSPHFIGHGGIIAGEPIKQAFAQADVVLSVGCRYSSWMWDEQGPLTRNSQTHININIDPSSLGHPALHSLAIHADAGQALADLLERFTTNSPITTNADWLSSLRGLRQTYLAEMLNSAKGPISESNTMHPALLADTIGKSLPADSLVVFDGGHTTFWSNDLTPVQETRTRFHEPGMSHLGFGLPYGMALKLLHPNRTVINITGDGSFGFTMNELDSARRHGLTVITIIHNNASWGIIRSGQKNQMNFELGTDLEGSDYAAIARGFGCHGETVQQVEDFSMALARSIASGKPAVIDCKTKFLPHPAMPMFGSMNRFNFNSLTNGNL